MDAMVIEDVAGKKPAVMAFSRLSELRSDGKLKHAPPMRWTGPEACPAQAMTSSSFFCILSPTWNTWALAWNSFFAASRVTASVLRSTESCGWVDRFGWVDWVEESAIR